MNVFVIPAWYPTADFPLTGIFVKEQLEAIAKYESSVKIGVGLWGQLDKRYLLWLKDPIRNLQKLTIATTKPYVNTVFPNLKEYHQPTYTWSRKVLLGNRKGILKAMLANYNRFEADFGKADLIHAHVGEIAGQLAMELAQIKKVPYLITEHMGPFPGPYAADKTGNLKPYYLRPYLRATANIAVSPFQRQEMARQQIPDLTTIPNFVDESYFKPGKQVVNQPFVFFTLARLTPEKGIDQLLHAFKLVLRSGKAVRLRVGGNGPYVKALQGLTDELEIREQVEWLGELNREQALQEYQQCNAFVLPSMYESFGMVYAEAIACGKPIIATKCGGPESIINHTNGLLVNKGDVSGLADAMKRMIENYDQYDSNLIRDDFMKRFSGKAVVQQLLNFYSTIITKHATSNK